MKIRQAEQADLEKLLELYTHLHDNPMPALDANIKSVWTEILADKNHHLLVGESDNEIVCSCVIVIIPNLTHHQRPYALIENVITHPSHRNRGYASQPLDAAKNIAQKSHCYKIMLMTGSKLETTLRFYEKAGYNRQDKTAFVQWLDPQMPRPIVIPMR